MIVVGIVLLLLGYLIPVPLLAWLGWILVVVGVIFWVLGATGRPVGGRTRWW